MPKENFWTLWCKGSLTQANTPTIQLGATPSRLTSAHLLPGHQIRPIKMVLFVPRGFLLEQIEEKTKWVLANPGLLRKRPFK